MFFPILAHGKGTREKAMNNTENCEKKKKIIRFSSVPRQMINPLWRIYRDAFADSPDSCAQEQRCYTKKSFTAALCDRDYLKLVILDNKEKPEGFILATKNMKKAKIAYICPQFYRKRFPQMAKKKRILYITALCCPHKAFLAFSLITALVKICRKEKFMVAFDYSEEKTSFLPTLIGKAVEKLG